MNIHNIFDIKTPLEFNSKALEVFRFQFENNQVYKDFCKRLRKSPENVSSTAEIPFLPIEFFKTKEILSSPTSPQTIFSSSGTTGNHTSKHLVASLDLYEKSYRNAFEQFYGPIDEYCVLALLPSYLEREGSSLIYMVDDLIKRSTHKDSGFYLDEFDLLASTLKQLEKTGTKIILIGVSFALLDFVEKQQFNLTNTIIMETGGMKGRRKEMIRTELHQILAKGFGVDKIHSEYGMTELLSQAYSKGDGVFDSPPWMQVFVRDTEDPLTLQEIGKTGGLNIIDLANIYSCSFIATQDLAKLNGDGSFEILGRFDNSDIRGCNLMVL